VSDNGAALNYGSFGTPRKTYLIISQILITKISTLNLITEFKPDHTIQNSKISQNFSKPEVTPYGSTGMPNQGALPEFPGRNPREPLQLTLGPQFF
jgi:hypothetical protein